MCDRLATRAETAVGRFLFKFFIGLQIEAWMQEGKN